MNDDSLRKLKRNIKCSFV